ncbi:EPT1 Ethanolaminephosphotransferase, partial [Erithacus rubecula]|nr:EPT1 Ethanolaminephosphotransferase [Erithacus rubecula]
LLGFVSLSQYSAVDSNPLSLYVMHPFWNAVVKIFPTWLAPNLITFSGFLLLVFNFFLMAYFDPDFYASAPDHQHVPSGVWIVVGILNFMAYTLDGVDGKQARRTNSSTPLGELFDHGLDSWACVYFVVTVYSTFGRGSTGVSVFVLYLLLWVVLFSFILSHWEKYNTGILFLPWGYDVSQVTISIVYIVTAFVGVEAWYAPFLFNFLYRDLFTAMIIVCALTVTLPMSLYNFYKAYKNNTLKHHSVYEILLPLVSPVLLFLLCTTWIFLSPTDILEVQPRLFYFMVGTAFANISVRASALCLKTWRIGYIEFSHVLSAAKLLFGKVGKAAGLLPVEPLPGDRDRDTGWGGVRRPAEQALQHPTLLPTETHSGLTGSRGGENRPAGCRRTVNTCCKYL